MTGGSLVRRMPNDGCRSHVSVILGLGNGSTLGLKIRAECGIILPARDPCPMNCSSVIYAMKQALGLGAIRHS